MNSRVSGLSLLIYSVSSQDTFVTHNLDGKARGTIALVVGGVSVVIGKVEVRWDVGGGFL